MTTRYRHRSGHWTLVLTLAVMLAVVVAGYTGGRWLATTRPPGGDCGRQLGRLDRGARRALATVDQPRRHRHALTRLERDAERVRETCR